MVQTSNPIQVVEDEWKSKFNMKKVGERFKEIALQKCPEFVIDDENREVINAVIAWYCNHESFNSMKCVIEPDLNKGIMLVGNVGTGKSLIMEILRDLHIADGKQFGIINSRHVSRQFADEGYEVIDHFGRLSVYFRHGKKKFRHMCFDELGAERTQKHFGNAENTMAEIILDRYDHFIHHRLMTNFTSNHTRQELETIYGDRVKSRLDQMCSFIPLGVEPDSKDRRLHH